MIKSIATTIAGLLMILPMPDIQSKVAEISKAARTPQVEPSKPTPPPSPVRPVQVTTAPSGGVLACIRRYEQGRAGYRTNTGNGYYGAYQFSLATWRSVGGTGYPHNASVAEQDKRASILLSRRGLQPWPTPNRLCR